jgi:hypothetical protein
MPIVLEGGRERGSKSVKKAKFLPIKSLTLIYLLQTCHVNLKLQFIYGEAVRLRFVQTRFVSLCQNEKVRKFDNWCFNNRVSQYDLFPIVLSYVSEFYIEP